METTKKEANSEGLTLIELMVALAIFGLIVTGIIFYLMRTSQSTGRRIDVAVTIQQETRVAMEQLSRELRQAGYRRSSDLAVGPTATATEIEFEADITGDTNPERIAYRFFDGAIKRRQSRTFLTDTYNTLGCGNTHNVTWEDWTPLARNIRSFNLTYINSSGASTSTPTCADLTNLQRVIVDMEAQVDNPYPDIKYPGIPPQPVTVKLRTEIQTRNSGIFGGCDNTAPGMPAGFAVEDTCLCVRLRLAWNTVVASDLAGYTIFVGRNPGIYDTFIDVGKINTYTLDQFNANLQPDIKYYVGIAARDTCRNISPIAELTVDRDGCGAGSTDTKPSPTVPEIVDVNTVEAVSGAGTVTLRWDPIKRADNSIRDDLNGYRVYRRPKDTGTFACINCGGATGVTVPFVTNKVDKYQFIDNDPALVGCQVYDYYIVGVNCRGEGPPTANIHGDGAGPRDPADFPSAATNTTPADTQPPADPTPFAASPGSKEVYLTFTTPNDADFDGVLILYSTAGYPPTAVNGQEPIGGSQAYKQAGLIRNNTVTYRQTGLTNGTRYYYRAYAFDRCGNYSPGTAAAQTAQPCNDGTSAPYPWYHGTPNAPKLLSLSYCRSSVTITWEASKGANPLDGTHDNDIPDDLMLYYIYRDGVKIKEVAATTQAVDSDFDPNAFAGKEVVYEVSAVDCVPNESLKSNSLKAYPGGVIVDETNKDKFVTRGANHNEFFFLIRNTSAAIATVNSMSMIYNQPTARIQRVDFYTVQATSPLTYTFEKTAFEDTSLPVDLKSNDDVLFTDKPQLAGQGPLASYRVVRVVFTDQDGNTPGADMRGETITITFKFFLAGSAAGTSCTETSSALTIPNGPRFSNTAQQPPSSISFLPSTTLVGSYIVPGGQETNVQTFITTDTGATPIAVSLFWTETSKSVLTAPIKPYPNRIDMISLTGNEFILFDPASLAGSKIPAQDGKRVWYYIIATDAKNNISMDPAIINLAYTYDQAVLDPCTTTPKNPASLTAATCATVRLSWSPVTQNTDGTTIADLAGYKVYRYLDALFTTLDAGFPVTVGPTEVSYNDTSANPLVNHFYKVTAFDSCTNPGPKESSLATAPTVTSPAFAGASGSTTVTPSVNNVHPFIYPPNGSAGDAGVFRITISDPTLACDATSDQIAWVHMCAASGQDDDWFRVKEDGNSGVFRIDSAFYGGRDFIQAIFNSLIGPTNPQANLDLKVNKFDTINICWNREAAAGSEGTACAPCVVPVGPANQVFVTPDPCLDTPSAPTSLTGSKGTGNSRMNLSWTAPTTNTDGSPLTDLVGYNIYRRQGISGSFVLAGQVTTTSVSNYDVGVNLNLDDYYFAVAAIDSCSPPNESAISNVIGPF